MNYKIRTSILQRDKSTCQHCNWYSVNGDGLEVHHIIARQDGGNDEDENLITLCWGCHREWESVEYTTTHDFGFWLSNPPVGRFNSFIRFVEGAAGEYDNEPFGWIWDHFMKATKLYIPGSQHGDESPA